MIKKDKNYIWAIFDPRDGNRNQLLGVLSELQSCYKVIEVSYNIFSFLPNFILQILGGVHIKENLKKIKINPYPKLIISCGRRTAPISLKIYKILKKKPLLVHLMYPRFTFDLNKFDIIFTPQHDNIKKKRNVFFTLGTPNNMNSFTKKKKIKKNNSLCYTLLIGGNHSNFTLSVGMVKLILKKLNNLVSLNSSLFISTSRRTSKDVIGYLDNKAKLEYSFVKEIFHPNKKQNKENPLYSFIRNSSEVIVTGDSMSMISEMCSIKKPVRLFFDSKFCSKKHISFCKNMICQGYAFSIETLGKKCNKIKVLNTSKVIASKIKKELLNFYGKNIH